MAKKQLGGNTGINIVLWIFGTIGLMALIYLIIVNVTNYVRRRRRKQIIAAMSPPLDYMQQTGVNCPDYWIRTRNSNNRVYCSNSFNLKQKSPDCPKEESFREIDADQWNTTSNKSKIRGVQERCRWLDKCGGPWQGIREQCN